MKDRYGHDPIRASESPLRGTSRLSSVLTLKNVSRNFGGVTAVDDVSFSIETGGITGLIGPNGAGKTTLFNLMAGTTRPSRGRIELDGVLLSRRDPGDIARKGVVRSFQSTMVIPGFTVADHLEHAALLPHIGRPGLIWRRDYAMCRQAAQRLAADLAEFFELTRYGSQLADALPYGLQKMLGLAMAAATRPLFLLADEPAAGLNASETAHLAAVLQALHEKRGLTIVLIEHDMKLVMGVCDRIVALAHGRLIADGTPAEVRANPAFIEAYLGGEA